MSARDDLGERATSVALTLAVDAETLRVVTEMRSRGVRAILLRGAAFTDLLGYRAGERAYVDSDLFVDPDSFRVAEDVLRRLGYRESDIERVFTDDRPQHAHTWLSRRGVVDLHRTLVGVPGEAKRVWGILSTRTETLPLLGGDVEVLAESARLLVVALHATQHAGETGVVSDLARAISHVARQAWEDAADLSRLLDAEEPFAAGLRTTPAGAELADGLGLSHDPAQPGINRGSNAFHLAQGLIWLSGQRGVAAKLRYVRSKIVPPRTQMRGRSNLARRGSLGLALAHLQRWMVLAVQLPNAVRALLRLARERRRRRA